MMNKKIFWLVVGVLGSASAFAGDDDNEFNAGAKDPSGLSVEDAVAGVLTGGDGVPKFTWTKGKWAAEHRLWVDGGPADAYVNLAGTECVGGADQDCKLARLPPNMNDCSTHTAWVQSNNANGPSNWSAPYTFQYKISAVAAAAVAITGDPAGPHNFAGPAPDKYEWTKVANASWYQLWVNDQNSGQTEFTKWIDANDPALVCSAAAPQYCTYTAPAPMALTGGPDYDYVWWVRAWNCSGVGPWTAGVDFHVDP